MKQIRLLTLLVLLMTAATGAWATPNSIVINGTPQVGDKSISLTYHFDPANVPGITSYAPTLKVKCAADNKWDEMNLSLTEVSSGTTNISLNTLGEFEAGKTYEVCFAYNNGGWVDEVFQTFVPAPAGYTVSMKDGVKDADKWTVKVGEGEAQALPIGGLNEGDAVTLQYNGRLKVKGVKATSDAAPAANPNAYLKWDATKKELVEAEIPATATKVANADAGVTWAAGTYVVEGNVTIGGTITLSGNVNLIIKDGAKLTANQITSATNNLSIYGQAQMTGELVVNSTVDAIKNITTLEVHSAKVTAISSGNSCGGFYRIETFNVYGGLVDAEYTGGDGYGISLNLNESGSMNIYGGEVKAEGDGNGDTFSYGIRSGIGATVTVYGGTLWAENADNAALRNNITLKKGGDFSGKIETSDNGTSWTEHTSASTPTTKYVRVGY